MDLLRTIGNRVQAARHSDGQQVLAAASGPTLNFALENRTTSNTVFAYVTGLAIDNNNARFLLRADGRTPYFPSSPARVGSRLSEDCAIRLGPPGSTTTVTIPHLAGGRIYFSIDSPLTFLLNPGPALVEPSISNPSDPNIDIRWDFAEFTWNASQLFANITYVDFVCLPIALTLESESGNTQHISGTAPDGLDRVCNGLREQQARDGRRWSNLIVTRNGRNLRALSPNNGITMDGTLFQGYYQPYVNEVWAQYSRRELAVNTQAQWGILRGRVVNGQLRIGNHSFSQPSTADIFSCSTGPFAAADPPERGALVARLAAAFNRSTLLNSDIIPAPPNVGRAYQYPITNHYARIVHSVNLDGRGYAFPYDDVAPDDGRDQSGAVFDSRPRLLRVAVGGQGAYA
ncbi:hypothetical protein H2201_007784 [Coniosporium apollinis]|uniref:GH64 domain-containing protein n=2 Tax=Coniosporium TaxID=2810619 RepID=A0ABQ9NLF7_9PEZI|nr:hypothetical protein H2199_003936 [Cladosporium sp. JES 115]KAJ9658465.1 hypothetical protein H2201_007784 [Coniosporium apollinis]